MDSHQVLKSESDEAVADTQLVVWITPETRRALEGFRREICNDPSTATLNDVALLLLFVAILNHTSTLANLAALASYLESEGFSEANDRWFYIRAQIQACPINQQTQHPYHP